MKKTFFYLLVMIGVIIISCHSDTTKVANWSDEKVNGWFDQSIWSKNLPFIPDESIDKRLFVQHHEKSPDIWKIAFDFMNRKDLTNLPVGRYDLSDNGIYATVSIYETKQPDEAKYESHRKFIDIQYVAEGEEYIEILPLSQIQENAEYDTTKDILFYTTKKEGNRRYADPRCYFVFFPEDAHKPCLKVDTQSKVKKIVVKIPIL